MLSKIANIPGCFYADEGRKLSPWAYAFLVIVCLAFFLPGIASLPPTDRDESSFAQATKQMIETGNYTDIRLQDQPRYKKPVGIYWLQAAAVKSFNPQHLDEIWAYRLPSLAGATLAVLMTAALGALLFGPQAGLLAALFLASCTLLNIEARLAKTDAALLGCITVALYALARVYKQSATQWGTPLTFWTALAVGILIKGPLILLPVLGTILVLGFIEKNWATLRALRPLPGLLYMLALVSPWFIAIMLQSHGAFAQQSALQDMLAKIWQAQNRAATPPGSHLTLLPVLFFPFVYILVLAIPDIWKNRKDAAFKFLLAWIIPTWLVFEFSTTKLPHYVLPAYPALALLAAKIAADGFPTASTAKRRLAISLVTILWILIGVGYAFVMAAAPLALVKGLSLSQIAAGITLVGGQVFLLRTIGKDKLLAAGGLAVCTALFFNMTIGTTLPSLKPLWMSREIVQTAREHAPCAESQIVTAGYSEPSLVFLAGTKTLLAKQGEAAATALSQDACRIAAITAKEKDDFLAALKEKGITPNQVAEIGGINTGHGSMAALTLFVQGK